MIKISSDNYIYNMSAKNKPLSEAVYCLRQEIFLKIN
jgi:hypothetical protein